MVLPLRGLMGTLLLVTVLVCSSGASKTWNNFVGNNNWNDGDNWNPSGVPNITDDVVIPYNAVSYGVIVDGFGVCRSLLIGGPAVNAPKEGGALDLPVHTLRVSGTLSLYGNCTVYLSGVLSVGGTGVTGLVQNAQISVKGTVLFTSGIVTVSALTIVVQSGGYMALQNTAVASGLILADSAGIVVAPGGNLTLASTSGIINTDNSPVYAINNGYWLCAPDYTDNYVTVLSVPLQNYGTLSIQSGSLTIDHDGLWSGTLEIISSTLYIKSGDHQFLGDSVIQGNGTLQVQNDASVLLQGLVKQTDFVLAQGSASITINSPITMNFVSFVMLGGSLTGSAAQITNFTWSGGSVQVSSLAVNQLQIMGAFTASMTSTQLSVQQSATFQDTTHLLLYNSTFAILPKASMPIDDLVYFLCNKTDTISAVQIAGQLQISYPDTITLTCPLVILTGGVVDVMDGTLDIQTPVSSSGVINIGASSTLIMESTGSFFTSSSISGGGTLDCQSCNILITGQVSLGNLNFPSGTITIEVDGGTTDYLPSIQQFNQSGSSSLSLINNSPAVLNFTVSNFYFSGGAITSNHNQQLGIQSNLVISNTASFYAVLPYLFTNVALLNEGAMTFYGGGTMKLWQNSLIYNAAAGSILVQGNLLATQNDGSGFMSDLWNFGLVQIAAGVNPQFAINVRNRGGGKLVVSGQLSLVSGFFTQEDDSVCSLDAGSALDLVNSAVFLGGTLKGEGLIKGSVVLDGGTLLVNSESSLTVSGSFQLRGAGILDVDVASAGELSLQSTCQISGGGLILYSSDGTVPYNKQFVSAQSISGSGIANFINATFNATHGFTYSNSTSSLNAVLVPNPRIDTITPNTGAAGTTITISGSNFFYVESDNNITVLVQGIPVPSTLMSKVNIQATIPIGTGTDIVVEVVTNGRMSNGVGWAYSAPVVQSITPNSGSPLGGDLLTIEGANFGNVASAVSVLLGPATCMISEIANDQITCSVPPGLGSNLPVVVQVDQQTSNALQYSYFPPAIQSIYPSVFIVNEPSNSSDVTITGQNLASSNTIGNITVTIGEYKCTNVVQTSLVTLTCSLPQSVTATVGTYPVQVTVAGQSAGGLNFRVVSTEQNKPVTTNNWWPFPWWIFVAAGGAVLLALIIGVGIGCALSKPKNSDRGYSPISTTVN